jgi:hypothetical protein
MTRPLKGPGTTFRTWALQSNRWRFMGWVTDRKLFPRSTEQTFQAHLDLMDSSPGFGGNGYEHHLRDAWNEYASETGAETTDGY